MEDQINHSDKGNKFSKIQRSSQDSAYGSLNSNSCWSLSESLTSGFMNQAVQLPSNIRNTDNKLVFGAKSSSHDNDQKKRRFKPLMTKQLISSSDNTKNQDNKYSKTSNENKSLQVAALSQALGFIDKFRQTQESKTDKSTGPNPDELYDLALNLQEAAEGVTCALPGPLINPQQTTHVSKKVTEVFAKECIEKKSEDAFCSAVSLHDGLVVHTTSTITDILGYPKDMWMGRSFIDFIHPEDRLTFTSQIGSGITLPLVENGEKVGKKNVGTCFCRIRKYNGLKSGCFAVKERKTTYDVVKLSVCFKNIDSNETNSSTSQQNTDATSFGTTFLFITAIPVNSAYSVPYDEGPFSGKSRNYSFTTKHDVDCMFSMVDESSISFLGFLPQDLHGQDIFKFYHPLDLPILKEAFEAVTTEQGVPFRSKPYRIKARNDNYVLLTTEFCSFINPWSRQLEFIIGKHTVIKGPKDTNIFIGGDSQEECEGDPEITEEMEQEAKLIQEEMKHLLSKPVHRKLLKPDDIYQNSSKRRKELTNFMETLLGQMAKYENKRKEGIIKDNAVVLEEISSPEDSIESPPSYNQLNYNENISRFFNSQPKTLTEKEVMDGKKSDDNNISSDDIERSLDNKKTTSKGSSNSEEGRRGSRSEENQTTRNTDSPVGTGESSSIRVGLSVGNQGQADHGMSQESNCSGQGSLQSGNGMDIAENYKSLQLTEELLQVHNKGMEKKMIDNYKQTKKGGELRLPDKKSSTRFKSMSYNEAKKHNHSKSYEKSIKYIQSKKNNTKNSTKRKEGNQDGNNKQLWTLLDNNSGQSPPNFNFSDNIIGVPAFYISALPPVSQFVDYSNHPGMMVQTGPAYIPFATISQGAMGQRFYPQYPSLNPEISYDQQNRIHHTKTQPSETLQKTADKITNPKSCMVESHGPIKTKNVKFLIPETVSVKAEPGSALESDAPESILSKETNSLAYHKDRNSVQGMVKNNGAKHNKEDRTENFTESEKLEADNRKTKVNVRPVLSEPFWNENVTVNQELLFNYQLDVRESKDVLCEDMEQLKMMNQPIDVNEQLEQLYKEVNRKGEDLFSTGTEFTDDESANDSKPKKIMKSDDMMNIFYEDDAQFPSPPGEANERQESVEKTTEICETPEDYL